jgi:uncharacterized membrane protein YGL010W
MGCKVTHLFGVPMIALSLVMLLFDRKKAVMLFSLGWLLQFLGHYLFEHNKPILLTRGRSPYTLLSALVFVGEEWVDTVKSIRSDIAESNNGQGLRHL